jgi:hypothetical protein
VKMPGWVFVGVLPPVHAGGFYYPSTRSVRLEGIVCVSNEYGCAEQRQPRDQGFQHDASLSF